MNIIDVAREAGVSTATVSRVLNGGSVSDDARTAVEAAIKKLNYLPNNLARGLVTGQTKTIGVIIHSVSNYFSMEFVEAVGAMYREQGYLLFVASTESAGSEEECRYISGFISQRVDGIILHDPPIDNYRNGFLKDVAKRIPFAMVHSFPDIYDINSVYVDQRLGMERVMSHLLGLGHRDIWFVRSEGFSEDLKEEVWRSGLRSVGREPSPDDLIFVPDGNKEIAITETEEIIGDLFQAGRRPSAIFACNDLMCAGVAYAASRHGIAVPDDLSLVGHDNTILAASGRFSSVDLKMGSVGRAAVDLLAYAIEGKDPEPRRVLISPDVFMRGSTKARALADPS